MDTASWGTIEGTQHYCDRAVAHAPASEYPHSTLNNTPIYSSHSGTALYETHIACNENSGCEAVVLVLVWIMMCLQSNI